MKLVKMYSRTFTLAPLGTIFDPSPPAMYSEDASSSPLVIGNQEDSLLLQTQDRKFSQQIAAAVNIKATAELPSYPQRPPPRSQGHCIGVQPPPMRVSSRIVTTCQPQGPSAAQGGKLPPAAGMWVGREGN